MADNSGQYYSLINAKYNELFGRDAAPEGLAYWGEAMADPNSSITAGNISDSLVAGAQGQDLENYNNSQINSSFNSQFGRDAKPAGLDYWGDALSDPNSGITSENLGQSILAGAQDFDIYSNIDIKSGGDGIYKNNTADNSGDSGYSGQSGATESDETTVLPPGETLPVTMPEVSMKTVAPYVPSTGSLTTGQLSGLLASNGVYMQAARKAGERDAQARGLLNSSLATEAAEKAAIEAALPIAQQDSSSLITTAADQNIINAKAYQSAQLSSQEAEQTSLLNDQQNKAAAALSEQQNKAAAELSAQQSEAEAALSAQENEAAAGLSAQEREAAAALSAQESEATSELSAQEAEQAASLEEIQQQWANYRQQVELDFNSSMSSTELSTTEKTNLASSLQALGESFQANVAGIQISDKGKDTRTAAINDLAAIYESNVEALSSIYGVDVTWSGFEADSSGSNSSVSNPFVPNPSVADSSLWAGGESRLDEYNG